ncbi:MAG: hypothetical protein Q7T25_07535 [Sideroxyarcus sp.]|nr:hypothetical protein [Sideroxyarcus sp.]
MLLAGVTLSARAQPAEPTTLPAWLQTRVATFEKSPLDSAPDGVWQFEYRGQQVYYIPAPCCDQFDRLYAADGAYLCAPGGGYLGVGDQRCPDAIPKSGQMKRVWSYPESVRKSNVDSYVYAPLEPFFRWYMASWLLACFIAIAIYIRNPASFSLSRPAYRRFLLVPWKLVTFFVATIGITLIAPYTGDPTWDYFDAFFMAVLTFFGAPWVVGVVYLVGKRQLPFKQLYVALCLWMFSVSWSYDLYLVLRDGRYPETWLPNIFASSVLYLSAGLLWNLDWRVERGMTFSFLENDWPSIHPTASFSKVFWVALPFMLIAAAAILYFVTPNSFT